MRLQSSLGERDGFPHSPNSTCRGQKVQKHPRIWAGKRRPPAGRDSSVKRVALATESPQTQTTPHRHPIKAKHFTALVCLTGQPGSAGTCTTRTGSRFRRWSSRVRNIRTTFLCTNVSFLENWDRPVHPSGASFVHTRRLKLYAHKSNECHQVWARGFLFVFVVIYGQNHAALTHALTVSPLHTQTTPATKLRPAAQSFPRCRAECCASEKHQ